MIRQVYSVLKCSRIAAGTRQPTSFLAESSKFWASRQLHASFCTQSSPVNPPNPNTAEPPRVKSQTKNLPFPSRYKKALLVGRKKREFMDLVNFFCLTNTFKPVEDVACPILRNLYKAFLQWKIPSYDKGDYRIWAQLTKKNQIRFSKAVRMYLNPQRKKILNTGSVSYPNTPARLEEFNVGCGSLHRLLFRTAQIRKYIERGVSKPGISFTIPVTLEVLSNEIFFYKVFSHDFLFKQLLPQLVNSSMLQK